MITDDDRERIIERIRVESEVRKQLANDEAATKPSRWAWVESKLGLLIIGVVLTGVLIPLFQATQETIRWSRQNRYDNLKYRVESARSATKELTVTHAFVAEAFERARVVSGESPIREEARQNYKGQVLEMQNRRFQQNAKFVGTLELLDETTRESITKAFNVYLSSVQQFMQVLEIIAQPNATVNGAPDDQSGRKREVALTSLAKDVDENYERILAMLKMYLHGLEVQSEKYF